MPTSPIIIIVGSGGGGNQTNVEFGQTYNVVSGDAAQNSSSGVVDLVFTGANGTTTIPLPGLSGIEFEETGSFVVYQ